MSTETTYICDNCGKKGKQFIPHYILESKNDKTNPFPVTSGDWCAPCRQSVIDALENRKRLEAQVTLSPGK